MIHMQLCDSHALRGSKVFSTLPPQAKPRTAREALLASIFEVPPQAKPRTARETLLSAFSLNEKPGDECGEDVAAGGVPQPRGEGLFPF